MAVRTSAAMVFSVVMMGSRDSAQLGVGIGKKCLGALASITSPLRVL